MEEREPQPEPIKKIQQELEEEFRETGIEDSLAIEGIIVKKPSIPPPTPTEGPKENNFPENPNG